MMSTLLVEHMTDTTQKADLWESQIYDIKNLQCNTIKQWLSVVQWEYTVIPWQNLSYIFFLQTSCIEITLANALKFLGMNRKIKKIPNRYMEFLLTIHVEIVYPGCKNVMYIHHALVLIKPHLFTVFSSVCDDLTKQSPSSMPRE